MKLFLALSLSVISIITYAQEAKYLVFFKDKGGLENLNKQADFYDVPVAKEYIDILRHEGKIHNQSKWLNGVYYSTLLSEQEIASFNFVKDALPLNFTKKERFSITSSGSTNRAADSNLYNFTYNQLEITKTASCLHDNNFKGNGITIAVLDAGFPKVDSLNGFQNLRNQNRIVDTWDFESDTSYVYYKHPHGTYVSSIITGEIDSTFIGSAPRANFALYITEMASVEINLEEYNLVRGLERADSIGADIASISLGYRDFDTLQTSYGYVGMDGTTTIVAQGVTIAQKKGMIIVTSAGNSGSQGTGSLSSPCDADSILCVGAINYDSTKANFSSEGPTADNRIKPDITTVGDSCYYIHTSDTIRYGNGTSFSCPLASGMVACLKQAHPNRTNYEIMDAVKASSHLNLTPDNLFGWGIPNSCKADSILTVLDSSAISITTFSKNLSFTLFPNPANDNISIISDNIIKEIEIIDLTGKIILTQSISTIKQNHILNINNIASGKYMVIVKDYQNRKTTKQLIIIN